MTIIDQLRAALRGHTQNEIAAGTGIPQSNISEFLAGKTDPRGATLAKLAEFAGVELRAKKPPKHTARQ